MSLPESFMVEGTIDFHEDHGCPYDAAENITEALDGSPFSVIYDRQLNEFIILNDGGDDA